MKKNTMTVMLLSLLTTGLLTNGCADTTPSGTASPEPQSESAVRIPNETAPVEAAAASPEETSGSTIVSQGGPYGEISLTIPGDWRYETDPMDSEQITYGLYGIRFYPGDVSDGYIALNYIDNFGVCGTGLAQEQTNIAGNPASIGTYDNHAYWDFIAFQDAYQGVVALTYSVDDWWETYSGQVMDILDTLSFDTSVKEGGAYVYSRESEPEQIGLSFSLKNISSSGATLVFRNYDAKAPTGSLEYGEDFLIEVQKNGVWEEVPVILEGDYAFNAVAFVIPAGDSSEQELNWEWLYGTLAPGTYRIRKSIQDFRGSGDFDKYTVYAQFILN